MLDIVYEDNHILVVIKPQNIPTQLDSSKDEDLLTMCKNYIKEKYNKPGEAYVGMVQRLDRPTGGLMVFAKTSKAAERLCEKMKNGELHKKYLTVVCGNPHFKKDNLKHYLKKDPKTNMVKIVPSTEDGAKQASLNYEVLDSVNNLSLIKVELETGRSHQIRVQMQSIKTPVYGDYKYGAPKKGSHLALWSYNLEFEHPVTGQYMRFICLPDVEETPWKYFDRQINTLAI